MINAEELAICRRRGHHTELPADDKGYVQCQSCGMWLREVCTTEEREDSPLTDSVEKTRFARDNAPEKVDPDELAICRRRKHNLGAARSRSGGWAQCRSCGTWVRDLRRIDEREDEPPEEELHPIVTADRDIAEAERIMARLLNKSAKAEDNR